MASRIEGEDYGKVVTDSRQLTISWGGSFSPKPKLHIRNTDGIHGGKGVYLSKDEIDDLITMLQYARLLAYGTS